METMRFPDGYFHLQLCYPGAVAGQYNACNEWKQTSNPATESQITGFEAVDLYFTHGFVNSL